MWGKGAALFESVCQNLLRLWREVTPSESEPVPVLYAPWATWIQGKCRVWVSNGQPGFQDGYHLAS